MRSCGTYGKYLKQNRQPGGVLKWGSPAPGFMIHSCSFHKMETSCTHVRRFFLFFPIDTCITKDSEGSLRVPTYSTQRAPVTRFPSMRQVDVTGIFLKFSTECCCGRMDASLLRIQISYWGPYLYENVAGGADPAKSAKTHVY